MTLTEDEAKTKWCHYSMQHPVEIIDGKEATVGGRKCIGSACMAWRWGPTGAGEQTTQPTGSCGLAGKP